MESAKYKNIRSMYLTYAWMKRVFMKYCTIFLSKIGFFLGKDFFGSEQMTLWIVLST